MDKFDKFLLGYGLTSFSLGSLVFILATFTSARNALWSIFGLVMGGVGGVLSASVISGYRQQKQQKQQDEKELAEYLAQKEEKQSTGKWEVPVFEFYRECERNGITDICSDYSLQKATLILQKIFSEHGLPEKYWDIYNGEASIKNYFAQGAQMGAKREQDEAYQKSLEQKKKLSPKKGLLEPNHQHYKEFCDTLSAKNGNEKRITMLSDLRDQMTNRIRELKEGQEAIKKLGMIMSQSVYQEPEKDWAVLGGIADGIAGGAAGLSTALNAMSDNREISARNRQRRESVAKTVTDMQVGAIKMSDDISKLREQVSQLNSQISDAQTKVTLNGILSDDLFAALKVNVSARKAKNRKSTEITGKIENTYIPRNLDIPENVKLTIDGILQVKVYLEDNLLDTFHVPLPVYGIECEGGKGEVKAYSESYTESDGEYRLEITPEKLWLMEL